MRIELANARLRDHRVCLEPHAQGLDIGEEKRAFAVESRGCHHLRRREPRYARNLDSCDAEARGARQNFLDRAVLREERIELSAAPGTEGADAEKQRSEKEGAGKARN